MVVSSGLNWPVALISPQTRIHSEELSWLNIELNIFSLDADIDVNLDCLRKWAISTEWMFKDKVSVSLDPWLPSMASKPNHEASLAFEHSFTRVSSWMLLILGILIISTDSFWKLPQGHQDSSEVHWTWSWSGTDGCQWSCQNIQRWECKGWEYGSFNWCYDS